MSITNPVDALGKPLAVGSKIVIPATITSFVASTYQGQITVQTNYSDNHLTEAYTSITVNSRQVITDH